VGERRSIRHNLCGNDPVRFARMILANAARVGCVAHIGDGIQALHVMRRRGGRPYDLGVIVVTDDPLEHHWMFCYLTGLEPLATPLLRALGAPATEALRSRCEPVVAACGMDPVEDFVHAPLINHTSFGPWAIARSGARTLRHKLSP
jgi:hypothetical protein